MERQINTHFYLNSRSRKTQKFLQPKTPHRAPFKTKKSCPQDLWPSKLLPLPVSPVPRNYLPKSTSSLLLTYEPPCSLVCQHAKRKYTEKNLLVSLFLRSTKFTLTKGS
ncbi:hypothetical protein ES332_A12G096400v1 [Gossypium tomentosum]|uniref:Uncharacterized protein n=1 Tax=Gossypium tomentosum TaxID=34277 RepID=A0A5D2MW16_GOSTO|nr:hypothetical protein ES332_A12G096400v1 [Gossypium tomentosum]